ncbi:MAG: zinc ribbon domain-containing protein [Oscillospiraceae bacterium]
MNNQWVCPKCGNIYCEMDNLQATGGNFSKIFDIQNKRFTTVTCTKCRYTELYKANTDELMNIIDFLIGN